MLDMLSIHLATHYSFFIALLSFSPWSGSYRLPMSNDDAAMTVDLPPGSFKDKSLDEILTLTDQRIQNCSAISLSTSPRVLAQVLGFKFAHYQVS